MNRLTDKYNRNYRYLRVSVTDRCNFRCKYCMPAHDFEFISHSNILKYEDMLFAVNVFSKLGIEKVRITGGEPLVRKNISYFIGEITKIPTIKEVTLTTNGSLLKNFAGVIYDAGIRRINISLDSLKKERYQYITGGFDINKLLLGIKEAKNAGINPIKINVVAIKGFNDDEIIDFCEFASKNDLNVRFIEFMPIGNKIEWTKEHIITGQEILEIISRNYEISPVKRSNFEGPAVNYLLSNGAKVGIITPISNHFCGDCDKLRLTADGKLRPCLLSDKEIDIFEALKCKDEKMLRELIMNSLNLKALDHNISNEVCNEEFSRTMSKIGG